MLRFHGLMSSKAALIMSFPFFTYSTKSVCLGTLSKNAAAREERVLCMTLDMHRPSSRELDTGGSTILVLKELKAGCRLKLAPAPCHQRTIFLQSLHDSGKGIVASCSRSQGEVMIQIYYTLSHQNIPLRPISPVGCVNGVHFSLTHLQPSSLPKVELWTDRSCYRHKDSHPRPPPT